MGDNSPRAKRAKCAGMKKNLHTGGTRCKTRAHEDVPDETAGPPSNMPASLQRLKWVRMQPGTLRRGMASGKFAGGRLHPPVMNHFSKVTYTLLLEGRESGGGRLSLRPGGGE